MEEGIKVPRAQESHNCTQQDPLKVQGTWGLCGLWWVSTEGHFLEGSREMTVSACREPWLGWSAGLNRLLLVGRLIGVDRLRVLTVCCCLGEVFVCFWQATPAPWLWGFVKGWSQRAFTWPATLPSREYLGMTRPCRWTASWLPGSAAPGEPCLPGMWQAFNLCWWVTFSRWVQRADYHLCWRFLFSPLYSSVFVQKCGRCLHHSSWFVWFEWFCTKAGDSLWGGRRKRRGPAWEFSGIIFSSGKFPGSVYPRFSLPQGLEVSWGLARSNMMVQFSLSFSCSEVPRTEPRVFFALTSLITQLCFAVLAEGSEGEEKSKPPLVEFLMGSCSLRFCVVHKNEKKNQILKSFSKWERKKYQIWRLLICPWMACISLRWGVPLADIKFGDVLVKLGFLRREGAFHHWFPLQGRPLSRAEDVGTWIPTLGWNPGVLHCMWILYRQSYQGSPAREVR